MSRVSCGIGSRYEAGSANLHRRSPDLAGAPSHEVRRFAYADDPRELWLWLEVLGRLGTPAKALTRLRRDGLAERLRPTSIWVSWGRRMRGSPTRCAWVSCSTWPDT